MIKTTDAELKRRARERMQRWRDENNGGYSDKIAKRRAECRRGFFIHKTCESCGIDKNLELHHKDPSIKIASEIWLWAEKTRNKELSKCQVLCHRCHMRHHKLGQHNPLVHGTAHGYRQCGCKCERCRKAHALYTNQYRNRVVQYRQSEIIA